MKFKLFSILFILFFFVAPSCPQTADKKSEVLKPLDIEKPLYKPFIERYILDELKLLRQNQQMLKAEVTEKVVAAKLESADRAIRYTADTTNNIFYMITATASIMVLLGWKSLRDVRSSIESITTQKISELTKEYESQLEAIEFKMKERSEQIIFAQEEIATTNQIHSLWMRAGLEKNEQEKIKIYDQILELKPDDVEVLTYKADVLLDLGEIKWALSLTNQAIDKDKEYSFAYWQRACSKAELGQEDEAIDDIEIAIRLSETLREELPDEKYFVNLKGNHRFDSMLKLDK